MMRIGPLILLTIAAMPPAVCLAADTPIQNVVGRSTSDRLGDLIDALVRAGRFDDALGVCTDHLLRHDPSSDRGAKWAIRKSQVLTARQMLATDFGSSQITAAQQPVTESLNAYPDHRRRLFLLAQQIRVRNAAATHQVVQASVSDSQDVKDDATESLVRVMTDTRELIGNCAEARTLIDRQRAASPGLSADLNRLQQELSVEVVTLSLMQTELFPPDSKDCIAAATKAEQAAIDAIKRVPSDTPARSELQRLRIAATLRAGQIARAASEFESVLQRANRTSAPWRALQVRIKLAEGEQQQAAALLADYFGEAPTKAPRSIELDIARLEFLLMYQSDEIAAWFDAIEQRGGDYARRRAESIALSRFGKTETDSEMNPSLLAAQGRARLRKGDRIRAGELLSASALADEMPDRALRHATQAAAAFASADQSMKAAKTLLDVAMAHQQASAAAAAHLQAIMLIRTDEPKQIESLLRDQLDTWPTGAIARDARRWLYQLLGNQGRFTDAAVALSNVPVEELNDQQFSSISDAWRAAFHQSADGSLSRPSAAFRDSMRPLLQHPIVQSQYRTLAAMLLNRDSLAGLPNGSRPDPFVDAFIQFRQQGRITNELRAVPAEYAIDARWRLMRDGRMLPQLRPSIAKLLQEWDQAEEPTFEKAELLFWSAEVESAIGMLDKLIQSSGRDVDALRQAATLLASSKDRMATDRAVNIWDQIAAGTRKGNPSWHQAKLSAIRLLKENGRHDEAIRRAKYVLLTMPNIDQQQRRKYDSVIP